VAYDRRAPFEKYLLLCREDGRVVAIDINFDLPLHHGLVLARGSESTQPPSERIMAENRSKLLFSYWHK
jgi:hypothetical protein